MSKESLEAPSYANKLDRENPPGSIRAAFRKIGAGALSATFALSLASSTTLAIENQVYNRRTTVQQIEKNPFDNVFNADETNEKFQHTSWLLIPGYNMSWHNSRETAAKVKESVKETGKMAWAGYQDQEIHANELLAQTLEYVKNNQISELNLYGSSFGGMVSIELATMLQNHGIKVPIIVLDSSPATNNDVINQAGLTLSSTSLLNPVVRSLIKTIDKSRSEAERNDNFDQNILKFLGNTAGNLFDDLFNADDNKISTQTLKSQADYILTSNIAPLHSDLSIDTKIVYIGSTSDETIDTTQAYKSYQKMFPDRYIQLYDSSPSDHASPIGRPDIYQPILKKIASNLIPVKPVTNDHHPTPQ